MGQQFLIDEILKPEDLDTTQLKINDSLNQKIWDGEKLKPKVRIHLLKIAQNFINFLNIDDDVEIHDIIFTGSLSNYNFNDYSDIDLHVILDHKEVIEDPDLAKEYFDTKKVLWNDRFDIKIYGFEVECYAQDANEYHNATGQYSVLNNKWIIKPQKKIIVIDKSGVIRKASQIAKTIDRIEGMEFSPEKIKKIDKLKTKIKRFRKNGLKRGGEYSTENLAFKLLRNAKYLDKLYKMSIDTINNQLTLEGYK